MPEKRPFHGYQISVLLAQAPPSGGAWATRRPLARAPQRPDDRGVLTSAPCRQVHGGGFRPPPLRDSNELWISISFQNGFLQSVSSNFALVRAAGLETPIYLLVWSLQSVSERDAWCERRQTVHQMRQERQEGEGRGQVSAPCILVPSNLALALQVPFLPWKKGKQRPKETQRQQPTSLVFPKKT